jgi:hypothetical protein
VEVAHSHSEGLTLVRLVDRLTSTPQITFYAGTMELTTRWYSDIADAIKTAVRYTFREATSLEFRACIGAPRPVLHTCTRVHVVLSVPAEKEHLEVEPSCVHAAHVLLVCLNTTRINCCGLDMCSSTCMCNNSPCRLLEETS